MTLATHRHSRKPDLKRLVGSGDRIALSVLPLLVIGVVANIVAPAAFDLGGPPAVLRAISIVVLVIGVVDWAWCAWLILTRVPRGELITHGPYAVVKHPLYTGVALLVLPWGGFLCNTWLGVVVGIALYLASRRFSPAEEKELSAVFGARWDAYAKTVLIPWL